MSSRILPVGGIALHKRVHADALQGLGGYGEVFDIPVPGGLLLGIIEVWVHLDKEI